MVVSYIFIENLNGATPHLVALLAENHFKRGATAKKFYYDGKGKLRIQWEKGPAVGASQEKRSKQKRGAKVKEMATTLYADAVADMVDEVVRRKLMEVPEAVKQLHPYIQANRRVRDRRCAKLLLEGRIDKRIAFR